MPKKSGREVRRHRVVVLLNDAELRWFSRFVERRRIPPGSVAQPLVMEGLERGER